MLAAFLLKSTLSNLKSNQQILILFYSAHDKLSIIMTFFFTKSKPGRKTNKNLYESTGRCSFCSFYVAAEARREENQYLCTDQVTSFSSTVMNTFPKLKVLMYVNHTIKVWNSLRKSRHIQKRLMKEREMQKTVSWRERKNKAFVCFSEGKQKKKKE